MRWLLLSALLVPSCSQRSPTPEECKALSAPQAVLKRCYGGNLEAGKYVGDLKCWPFSKSQRMSGLWRIGLEASEFYPNARSLAANKRPETWLETNLIDRRPELLAAAQGAGTRVYAVELQGREALCDGMFGHMGMYRREVLTERFYSMRLLPSLPS